MKASPARLRGFSLIELLVVMVVVGILTALAYPAYRQYLVRTHRGNAQACLAEHAQYMERYYTTHMKYTGVSGKMGCETLGGMDKHYSFARVVADRTYTITATPKGSQASEDAACGNMSLNEKGTRTVSGSSGLAGCWK